MGIRVGQGYDIHQLNVGRDLFLGGVKIPSDKGLVGHSDADALSHAIIDALFGAAGLGDIGTHFPDSDQQYFGASGVSLLRATAEKIAEAGYKIINLDSTVIAQEPRLAPYIESMRETIAEALGIASGQVNVKAKSNEKLDAVGEKRAIAAQATVLLESVA
jgi:2-C-methyl-D-erythritol 2,4-cyclodiphosphate synthase